MKELNLAQKKEFYEYLTAFVSDNKKSKIDEIVLSRTRHLTVVLEDIFQSQNASAVLRTCDCFGIQDVHIIENRYPYEINPDVELGSAKWLNLFRYNTNGHNTREALQSLKKKGYKIIATTPHKNDLMIQDLSVGQKFAMVFGTEKEGLSDIAIQEADAFVKIPMYGFTESFNISVSAAMSVFYLSEKIRQSGMNWQLKEDEIFDIKINWITNVIRMAEQVKEDFLQKKGWI
ncbi:MAG: RNA methyltransferase [Bacteroidetes bacterium]|nr:RNA methyltransferase [Bacteroidota bacterium]